jgi:hypothetical protein
MMWGIGWWLPHVQLEQRPMSDNITQHIMQKDILIPVLAITGGMLIAIIAIITSTIRSVAATRAREQTKRELAAYVAEGTLDPDKAVAMINAGRPHWESGHGRGVAMKTGKDATSGCCV